MRLLINPQTKLQIDLFLSSPSHALILSGPSGIGKRSLAKMISDFMLVDFPESIKTAYTKVISPIDDKQIPIEHIRELEHFLSLKVPSHNAVNRVAVIEDAQLLTIQAQNALLKTLEEPPFGTVIILTTNHMESLLVTIRSRAQQILIESPLLSELETYFENEKYEPKEVIKALSMSGGLPGLTQALLDGEDHPLKSATEMAKNILVLSTYKRLALVDELAKHKELCVNTFFILQQMARISLRTANDDQAKKWSLIYEASYYALEALKRNGQPKLVVCNFILSV